MKTTLLLVPASLALLAGCSIAARSPDMYRDDTKAALEKKNGEIGLCFDQTLKMKPGVGGKLTVTFDVMTETGKITNVKVDRAGTSVSDDIAECVTKTIEGVTLAPPDVRKGEGTWVYEFTPPSPGAAPAGVAPGKS